MLLTYIYNKFWEQIEQRLNETELFKILTFSKLYGLIKLLKKSTHIRTVVSNNEALVPTYSEFWISFFINL